MSIPPNENDNLTGQCVYCGRSIVKDNGIWIDPEVTGDDSIWRASLSREICDGHDTFTAEHIPKATQPSPAAVELALAERQANSEKINATVQAARASANQPKVGHLRHTRDILRQTTMERDALQAQRDELLAALKQTLDVVFNETAGQSKTQWVIQSIDKAQAAIARATEGGKGQ